MSSGRNIATDLFNMPVRKKRIKHKQKGNSNEGMACQTMSMWTGVPFARVPFSGALRRNNSEDITSDIIPDVKDFYFPIVVETKHLRGILFELTIKSEVGGTSIGSIWRQVLNDGIRAGKLPMAMLRYNGLKKFGKKKGVIDYTVPNGYQDYLIVMDRRFGGAILSLHSKCLYQEKNEKRDWDIMVFKFSDLITRLTYDKFASSIKSANLVAKFKGYAKDRDNSD